MLPETLQLHPATVIRFAGDRPHLHNAQCAGTAIPLHDPGTIALIASFARPQSVESMLARLPDSVRPQLHSMLEELHQRGLLRSPQSNTAKTPIADSLSAMANALHQIAQDAAALPTSVRDELTGATESALAAFSALRKQVREHHDQHATNRLAQLTCPAAGWQLHLGASGQSIPGWLAIDAHPDSDLPLNLQAGLPFDDSSTAHIYAAHVLEHLYYPGEVQTLLSECYRVLKPGGRMRLVVPDISQCLHAYARNDREWFAQRQKTWTHWPAGRTPLEDFLAYAGAGADPARALDSHKYGYDFETLERALQQAGFRTVTPHQFMRGADDALLLDEYSFAAGATHEQGHYSLFVEAAKP